MSDSLQFGQLLIADGLIQPADWQTALLIKERQGGHLLEILMGLCTVSERDLYASIARQLGLKFWREEDVTQLQVDPDLFEQFPPFLLLEHTFYPWYFDNEAELLHIILPNPLDHKTLDAIKLYAHVDRLGVGVATPTTVVNALQTQLRRTPLQEEDLLKSPHPKSSESSYNIAPPKLQLRPCPACGHQEPIEKDLCSYCGSPMDLAQADPLLHKQVSHFRLDRKLGEGGMGLVYQATNLNNNKEAAVKILRSHLNTNERVVRRFHREAQAQNQLRHPNIVHVHDFGFEESVGFFIAMEFLRGQSLEDIFEFEPERMNIHFLRAAFRQVCDAMGFAHSRGIYHRDLKPDNIFLMENPTGDPTQQRLKILDFGVAKMVASEEDQRLTRTGMTIGTPRYMSPEQAGEGNTDHRSDIYSLGIILFECLTGQPPFEGSSAYQIMLRHVYADPPTLKQTRSDLRYPKELEDLIVRSLAKDPQKRPPSMDLFWHELSDALDLFARLENPTRPLLAASPHNRRQQEEEDKPADPPVIVGRMLQNDRKKQAARTPAAASPILPPPLLPTSPLAASPLTPNQADMLVSLYDAPSVQSPLLQQDPRGLLTTLPHHDSPTPKTETPFLLGDYSAGNLDPIFQSSGTLAPVTPTPLTKEASSLPSHRSSPTPEHAPFAQRRTPTPLVTPDENALLPHASRPPDENNRTSGNSRALTSPATQSGLRKKLVQPLALKDPKEKTPPSLLLLIFGAILLVFLGGGITLLILYLT